MSNDYPREKYQAAISELTGLGTIHKRLKNAYGCFHPVREDHFSDEQLKGRHNAIIDALTAHETKDVEIGHVNNTLAKISEDEALDIATMIVELHYDLMRR
ncbi:hypothetical protein So717_17320 [Roseobacter cerasinus]|uniref:Uncharacterized protein n=1 Tax=Roseobacter cerasinus TaxID=2602289 RepID=A0A640VPN6_9RHOB|nr:hypothetical protein [Roseobacter cerasinus]GFE49979.1 hypothetical protein So717_17320 [Roseobacter cerasinus]